MANHIQNLDGYEISTDPTRVDFKTVLGFLKTSYWAKDIPEKVNRAAIEGSHVWSLFETKTAKQIGFARAATDGAKLAVLADVFVLPAHRGHGLGALLVGTALSDPRLKHVSWFLGTNDAHGLYEKFGFTAANPQLVMERHRYASDTCR